MALKITFATLVTSLECYCFITHVRNCVKGAATMETSLSIEIMRSASGIKPSQKASNKGADQTARCTGWSATLLF